MKKIIVSSLVALFLFGMFALSPTKSSAANTGIQISPVTFNFELAAGKSETGKIIITNRNDEEMEYVMELENFKASDEKGVPIYTSVKEQSGVSSFVDWVKFPGGDTGTIPVKKDKEVSFTITVPKDAEPGGHYGAIFAKQTKPPIKAGNAVGVVARVGALVLISVPGDVTQGAEVVEFSAPKLIWKKGPVDFTMRVKNTGTVHYDSKALASIKGLIGATTDIEMGTHTILPKNIRAYEGQWTKKYPFGYYRITPTAEDGSGKTVTGTPVVLWAFPLIIVIPVLVGLIIVILLIVYLRKHFRVIKQ